MSGYENYKAFKFDQGTVVLPPIRLFSPSERLVLQKIPGGEFKTSISPYYTEHNYNLPDIYIGMREVTWGDIRRNNVQLPSVMGQYTKPGADDEPVIGFLADWSIQLAEDLGGEICNELIWRYCDERSAVMKDGPQGFRTLPDEVTVTDLHDTTVLGYKDSQFKRKSVRMSESMPDIGFRIYIRTRAPQSIDELMLRR
jgi:hypothetical protein